MEPTRANKKGGLEGELEMLEEQLNWDVERRMQNRWGKGTKAGAMGKPPTPLFSPNHECGQEMSAERVKRQ